MTTVLPVTITGGCGFGVAVVISCATAALHAVATSTSGTKLRRISACMEKPVRVDEVLCRAHFLQSLPMCNDPAMRHPRRFIVLSALILAGHAGAASNTSSEVSAAQAADVFARYEAAFNRHDADAVGKFWAPDTSQPDWKEKRARTEARWKGERAFEAATHAVFRISGRPLGGDAYEMTQSEDCDFYDAIGSGRRITTVVVHLKDGRFHSPERGETRDTGAAYFPAKEQFTQWMLRSHPEDARRVTKDGEIAFDGDTAAILMRLVREWREDSGTDTSSPR